MSTIVLHSNRLYKKDLDESIVEFLNSIIKEYNSIKVAAYCNQLKRLRQDVLIAENIIAPPEEQQPSLYKEIASKFDNSSVYLVNSAINEAKAIQKSQDELLKLNIEVLKSKIEKINRKISKTIAQKQALQIIKEIKNINKYWYFIV